MTTAAAIIIFKSRKSTSMTKETPGGRLETQLPHTSHAKYVIRQEDTIANMRSVLITALPAVISMIALADAFSNYSPKRYANNAAKFSPRQLSHVDEVRATESKRESATAPSQPLGGIGFCAFSSSFTALSASSNDNEEGAGGDKFSFAQRIESLKCAVVGAVSGSLGVTLPAAYHNLLYSDTLSVNGMAQWEFDTDMGAIEGALFAIVYRYAIRTDENPMLNQGAVGAFVLVRTLSRISTPTSCSALPLSCGAPLGYANWDMINQGLLSGAESAALFGGAALAMEIAFDKGFIGKFR